LNNVLKELKETGEQALLQHSLLEELNLDLVAALGELLLMRAPCFSIPC
jgi:hypothetical protein